MPHLTLEVSGNLAAYADAMLEAVTSECQHSGHFEQAVLMSRAVIHERYLVRQQGMAAFVNLTLRIRAGRTEDIKAGLAKGLANALRQVTEEARLHTRTCITCEIQEVDTRTRALIYAGAD
jgi:5-carboxymethyl-2-hydroxymuconate isomerase